MVYRDRTDFQSVALRKTSQKSGISACAPLDSETRPRAHTYPIPTRNPTIPNNPPANYRPLGRVIDITDPSIAPHLDRY